MSQSDKPDNLRDRIIKAIGAEVYGDIGNSDLSLATRAADAVIEALKLHRDEELDEYGGYVPTGRHRYVTEWTTDE